jgi:hypothetical protein
VRVGALLQRVRLSCLLDERLELAEGLEVALRYGEAIRDGDSWFVYA